MIPASASENLLNVTNLLYASEHSISQIHPCIVLFSFPLLYGFDLKLLGFLLILLM